VGGEYGPEVEEGGTSYRRQLWNRKTVQWKPNSWKKPGQKWFSGSRMLSYRTILPSQQEQYGIGVSY